VTQKISQCKSLDRNQSSGTDLKAVVGETAIGSHVSWKRGMFGHFCDLHGVLFLSVLRFDDRVLFLSHSITGTE